ncbi:heme biosynthesis HemY N-terminal domain-containing protein [Amphiplicatus metriothermophilus]|uniref:HemY protein n=1 Tax=Amphiplicatus metriothermophilus TaxID=1519374 RepID=A0A239PKL7_9PROT|nr:heme biosynthesis HemY N-terminal domain-containing protein [Amphiplicatus metriothermophilus]MBB5517565.1 HemY protein [Amphiplicatus metriothermophilus]SNT68100.1 HemY protein [Amphiplicatus metriothermophilus]
MIRILIFILSAAFAAFLLTFLANMDGRIVGEAFDLRFDIHSGFAFGLALTVVGALIWGTSLVKDLAALPGKLKRKAQDARRERGFVALARGLEAAAVGDAEDARHHARVARRNLGESSLTRLLTAQAAQLAGDDETAKENFRAMLEAPETTFLGLRGLYLQARRAGDKAGALDYAEQAFRLRSNAAWAFESVLELGLERGAWGEMRAAVATALKNRLLSPEKARRAEAALLAADAYAAEASGEKSLALEETEAALKLDAGLAPAAILVARLQAGAGKRAQAAKALEAAFAQAPHPGLLQAYEDLYKDESVETRADALKRFAEHRPDAREAKLALARRHILLGEHDAAAALLEPLLRESATARECALMAEAAAGAGEEAAARSWLARAAAAPRDAVPGADGAFHLTREGWARLVREYMEHGRLAPAPLEGPPPGLSEDEIKRLAPPAAPPAAAGEKAASVEEEAVSPDADESEASRGSGAEQAEEEPDDALARIAAERARAVSAAGEVS